MHGILFVCLFVLTGSSHGSQLLHKLLGCKSLVKSFIVSPDALLDLGFCSQRLDASSRLGAPVGWEVSLGDEHMNRTLLFTAWTLFMAFLLPWVFGHQQKIS